MQNVVDHETPLADGYAMQLHDAASSRLWDPDSFKYREGPVPNVS